MTEEDQKLNSFCLENLSCLDKEFKRRAKPFIDCLIRIQNRQPPKPLIFDPRLPYSHFAEKVPELIRKIEEFKDEPQKR